MPRTPRIDREPTNVRRVTVRRWRRKAQAGFREALRKDDGLDHVELRSPRTQGWVAY